MTPSLAERLGTHRVVGQPGVLPQAAERLDPALPIRPSELLCDVDVLNIDSASFRQIRAVCGDDAAAIGAHVAATVAARGKQHNAVTGSGGMFVGRVREVGPLHPAAAQLRAGDPIASLVSLTLTPLTLEAILDVDVGSGRVRVRGHAVLFASGLFAALPDDIEADVALVVFDVAGAPAQVRRLVRPGQTVCVIGADGKSGLLSCAAARDAVGLGGTVVAIVPDATSAGAVLLAERGYADTLVEADARDAGAVAAAFEARVPALADITVNCVNVAGTELASILCTKDGGVVYFFSMSTSFTAAALGAEGVGKDVAMMIGNGYAAGHAAVALQTLRDHPPLREYFTQRYGTRPVCKELVP